jgi:hypothetical protein
MLGKLVEVIWRDASFDLDDEPKVVQLHTVGWVVRDDGEAIVIASERDSDALYFRGRTAVPRECIVEIKHLSRSRKRF